MLDAWYVDIGGYDDGPLSVDELRERAASGRLRPSESVSNDRKTWIPANSVDGLAFPTTLLTETIVSGSPSTE